MPKQGEKATDAIQRRAAESRAAFEAESGRGAEKTIARSRYQQADRIAATCVVRVKPVRRTITDWIDRFACNRFLGPILLAGILYGIYQLAIVQGYNLTDAWWPVLGAIKSTILSILPGEGLLVDPWFRSLIEWTLNGVLSVLNYLPIFAILFALVAILEDTGYMARIAFVLDRLFRPFGLHGQSALPLMLGGLFVGGCAIPGVMACRGIKDERARMTTMLVVPLMNCLAKTPFYLLLIGLFFERASGLVMFILSTITLLFALVASKVLSLTVLKNRPSAPFVLELPAYHLPTPQNVLRRVIERLWIFVKKITTVVAVVMVVLFVLLNIPGLNVERTAAYEASLNELLSDFTETLGAANPYGQWLGSVDAATDHAQFTDELRVARRGASDDEDLTRIDRAFLLRNPEWFKVANRGSVTLEADEIVAFSEYASAYRVAYAAYLDAYAAASADQQSSLRSAFFASWSDVHPLFFGLVRSGNVELQGDTVVDADAAAAAKAFVAVSRGAQTLRGERAQEALETSLLGRIAIGLEPVTRFAGFNWRINVGLIGAFAAKESVVATLGSIYRSGEGLGDEGTSLESRIGEEETGWTPLHAVSMMLFMALYPPCIAALLMIKIQAGWRWMLFGFLYPTVAGFVIAGLVFTGGSLLGLSGLGALIALYVVMLAITVVMGAIRFRGKGGTPAPEVSP